MRVYGRFLRSNNEILEQQLAAVHDQLRQPEGEHVRQITQQELITQAAGLVEKLWPREKSVVQLYFGLGGNAPHTFQEIADLLNVSRKRVGDIFNRAMLRLRQLMKQSLDD